MLRLAVEAMRMCGVTVPPAWLVPVYQQPNVLLAIKTLLVSLVDGREKFMRTANIRALISVLSG